MEQLGDPHVLEKKADCSLQLFQEGSVPGPFQMGHTCKLRAVIYETQEVRID